MNKLLTRHLMNTTVFAAPGTTTTATTPAKSAGAPKGKRAPAPVQTDIATDIPMPESVKGARGSKSMYKFDELTSAGMSFGIVGKTQHQMSSIISNRNKRVTTTQATNPDGSLKTEIKPINDANGAKIGETVLPVFTKGPQYAAADVKEKGGVTCRVWRLS